MDRIHHAVSLGNFHFKAYLFQLKHSMDIQDKEFRPFVSMCLLQHRRDFMLTVCLFLMREHRLKELEWLLSQFSIRYDTYRLRQKLLEKATDSSDPSIFFELWKIWKDDFCLNRILRPYRVCHVSIYETYISQMKNIQEFRNCFQTALEFENRSWIECLETHHPKWFQTYWETKESRYFINECLTDFEIYEFLQNKVGGFEMTDEFFLNFLTFPLEKSKIRIMDSIWKRHLSYRPCLDSLIQNENLYVFLTWTTEELEYLCQHVPFSFSFTLTLGPYLASEGHDRAIQWIIKTFSLESHLDLFIIPHSMSLLNSSIFQ